MLKSFFNTTWPHIISIAAFAFLSLAYVSPVLEGKMLFQSDIVKHIGMSKEIVDFRKETGEEPLWTNSMFGGMPAYQISVLYKNNIATLFHDILTLGLPRPADMIFLYFLGFFILMISLGANVWLSALAATGFALSSYHFIILEAGHNSKAVAIAYMAPALAGILMALKGKIIIGSIITAIFLGLQIYANHLQITYYLLIITIIVGAALLINDIREKQSARFFKALGALSLAAIIALGLNFSKLFTTWEYSKDTIRGGSELTYDIEIQTGRGLDFEYATQWSYGIGETFTLLVPNLKGGESGRLAGNEAAMQEVEPQFREFIAGQNHYWGEQPFTSGPVYVGVTVLFLFLFGAFFLRGPLKWALVIATILSIMLAWGRNFEPLTMFFLEHVPLYNKFRAVSMTLVIAELCIPFLAFLTLWKLIDQPSLIKTHRVEFLAATGFTAGIAILFYIAPRLFSGFITSQETAMFNEYRQAQPAMAQTIDAFIYQLREARIGIMQADAMRSFVFATITALVLW
ncbi:MAG TPA: hypothetical protein VLH16_06055, partial [Bacteroidales bacterium]|nr:hypothetical protein [Bacteroidales bacterium]